MRLKEAWSLKSKIMLKTDMYYTRVPYYNRYIEHIL